MAQKINPILLRLQYTNRHFDTNWYSDYFYRNLLTQDILVRNYLNTFLKLLKLPTGRYSIQHVQKKTQILSFFCYPKLMREWRSKVFGLYSQNKQVKKQRYFFKNYTKNFSFFSGNRNKKLKLFYTRTNQISLYKIQKKITSFQNSLLWSQIGGRDIQKCGLNKEKVTLSLNLVTPKKREVFTKNSPIYKQTPFKSGVNPKLQSEHFLNSLVENKTPSPFHLVTRESFSKGNHANASVEGVFLEKLFLYKLLKSKLEGNTSLRQKQSQADTVLDHLKHKTHKFRVSNPFLEFPSPKRRNTQTVFCSQVQETHQKTKETSPRIVLLNPESSTPLDLKYQNYLQDHLSLFYKFPVSLQFFKVKNDWQSATFLADEIRYFLEKRIPFRRLKNRILKQLSQIPTIRGVRITCSGRVGGKSKKAQRAKIECVKYGQTSLQVFSSCLDFSSKTAQTSFGSVGIKVWICYN